jgi:tetratricopeptide (TPR) repeat protein
VLRRLLIFPVVSCVVLAASGFAQQPQPTSKVSLDVSETLFSVITAINACGYDQELTDSDPLRIKIRDEVKKNVEDSAEARYAQQDLCAFYRDHQQSDYSRSVAPYISLALNLGDAPAFTPKIKEADMPPDAAYVMGIEPFMQRFYIAADLHGIWMRHQRDYQALAERNRDALAKMVSSTDIYLKLPMGDYAGRQLQIYVEPMIAPSQINARNYDSEYFVVVSPDHGALKLDQIRHTYLHFILDEMTLKRGYAIRRISALLPLVEKAPIDKAYKTDMTLLMTECLIRAIEARTANQPEPARREMADADAREGFILTPYFFDQLKKFEKEATGLNDAYGDFLYYINVDNEQHRASHIQFASNSAPDVLRPAAHRPALADAELKLASGDLVHANEIVQHALDTQQVDPGRAYFLMARIATAAKDPDDAEKDFQKAIELSHEARIVAWSHIYLARICDLKSQREAALEHYRAAAKAGDPSAYTKAAIGRGLQEPYTLPADKVPESRNTEATQGNTSTN